VFGKREKEKGRGGERGKDRIGEVQCKSECGRVLEKNIEVTSLRTYIQLAEPQ